MARVGVTMGDRLFGSYPIEKYRVVVSREEKYVKVWFVSLDGSAVKDADVELTHDAAIQLAHALLVGALSYQDCIEKKPIELTKSIVFEVSENDSPMNESMAEEAEAELAPAS